MFFRNLTLFRFPQTMLFDMEHGLAHCALRPVGPLALYSQGFIPPLGQDTEAFTHRVGDAVWLAVGGEEKLLPTSVVNDLLRKKLAEIEGKEGRKLGARARKRLKADLVQELLPRAFVRPRRTDAMLDLGRGLFIVDTASRKLGEAVVSEFRRAAGSFPALPVNAELAPRAVLTGWVAGDPLPDGLTLGDECELKDPADGGAVVKCQHQEMLGEEIGKHLELGKQVTRLALTLNDHLSFVIGEDLVIRKLRFLDGAVESLESTDRDDIRAELDARFALMAGEVGRLFDVLAKALRFSENDDGRAPARGSLVLTIGGKSIDLNTVEGRRLLDLSMKLEDVAEHIRRTGKTSISYWQRTLGCGYNQAARLIEFMESAGVVSAPGPDGVRTVLGGQE